MSSTVSPRAILRDIAGLGVVAALHVAGWAGHQPLYLVLAAVVIQAALQFGPLNVALSRRYEARWGPTIALHMLGLTFFLYAVGWGSAMGLAVLSVMAIDLRTLGAWSWRPALAWSLIWMAGGELLVSHAGLFSYLGRNDRFIVDGIVGITLFILASVLGRSAERQEREDLARCAAEELLRERQQRLDTLLGASFEMIALIGADGSVSYVSPSLESRLTGGVAALAGHAVDQLVRHAGLVHPEDIEPVIGALAAAMVERHVRVEVRLRDGSGETGWGWWEAVVTDLRDDPAVRGMVVNVRDVSIRKEVQAQLAEAALTDPLTGLPNRTAFLHRLETALGIRTAYASVDQPNRAGTSVAVLFIDLDGFKAVNDRLGHDWGDRLLEQVSQRLVGAVRAGEVVARWAGDEFVVLAEGVGSTTEAEAVAARLSDALGQCGWRVEGQEDVVVAGSIGVAMGRPGTISARELLRQADRAMYLIKSDRRPEAWSRTGSGNGR